MLDNYPPNMDHRKLDGETRDQQEAIERVELAQEAYKECIRVVAMSLRHYPTLSFAPDCMRYVGDAIGDLLYKAVEEEMKELEEANICIYPWPDNHRKVCDEAYNYITMGIL